VILHVVETSIEIAILICELQNICMQMGEVWC